MNCSRSSGCRGTNDIFFFAHDDFSVRIAFQVDAYFAKEPVLFRPGPASGPTDAFLPSTYGVLPPRPGGDMADVGRWDYQVFVGPAGNQEALLEKRQVTVQEIQFLLHSHGPVLQMCKRVAVNLGKVHQVGRCLPGGHLDELGQDAEVVEHKVRAQLVFQRLEAEAVTGWSFHSSKLPDG